MTGQSSSSELVVFTALFGDYENLVEQPMARQSGARFVCFTDNASLCSDSWEIRLVEPTIPWDSTRMARKVKILGYREFPSAETVWIDNRVVLRVLPEHLVDRYLQDADIALPLHSHRESVKDEFKAVLESGFEDPWRVREQLHYLSSTCPSVLDEVPYWTAIILRRRTTPVDRAMEVWLDMVMRHSRRDQLSVNYAFAATALSPNPIVIPNVQSDLHEWLRIGALPKRKEVLFSRSWRYTLRQHFVDTVWANRWAIALRTRTHRLRKART